MAAPVKTLAAGKGVMGSLPTGVTYRMGGYGSRSAASTRMKLAGLATRQYGYTDYGQDGAPPQLEPLQKDDGDAKMLNPVLRTLLLGARCPGSPLFKLPKRGSGAAATIGAIYDHVEALNKARTKYCDPTRRRQIYDWGHRPKPTVEVGFAVIAREPRDQSNEINRNYMPQWEGGINVNMMPFIMGQLSSLPPELRKYGPLLERCPVPRDEEGQVGYLTVHESEVPADGKSTQRRAGLHVECPAEHDLPEVVASFTPGGQHCWGAGSCDMIMEGDVYHGGIYMCSNVDGTTRVFDNLVEHDIIGPGGNIEHLRGLLGPGTRIKGGDIVWITDRTPHESMPMPLTDADRKIIAARAPPESTTSVGGTAAAAGGCAAAASALAAVSFGSDDDDDDGDDDGDGGGSGDDFRDDDGDDGCGMPAVKSYVAAAAPGGVLEAAAGEEAKGGDESGEDGGYRMVRRIYFRLVTSKISVWFTKHNTPNPYGVAPGPGVKIVHDDKFEAIRSGGGKGAMKKP